MAKAKVKKLLADLRAFRSLTLAFEAGAGSVGEIADRLGRVAAVRAELEVYEKGLKAVIVENGEAAVEGRLYRATLSQVDQEKLDTKAIREAMPEKWVEKFTIASSYTKVSVKARLGTGLGETALELAMRD